MSTETNKATMRRWFTEGWGGNLAVAEEIFAPEFTINGQPAGPETPKSNVAHTRAGFPDAYVTIEQQLAEGDWVVTRWTAHGTHLGSFNSIPATGKTIAVPGVVLWRFKDGKAVEDWTQWDFAGLLQQIRTQE